MSKTLCAALALAFFCLAAPYPSPAAVEKPVGKVVLDSGMTVLAQEKGGELAAACLFVKVGTADEDKDNNGITNLLNRVILACHPLGGSSPPALKIEQLGGRVGVETHCDFTCFTLVAPARNLAAAFKVLAEAVTSPDCSGAALAREKEALAARMDWMDDRLAEKAYRVLLQRTYGGLAYGLVPEGGASTIKRLGQTDIEAWHSAYYRPGNIIVSVCGKMSASNAAKMADEAFKGLGRGRGGAAGARTGQPGCAVAEKDAYEGALSGGMAAAVFGYTAPAAGSPDYPAMKLAEAVMAEGMGSRIFKALRDDRGAAYSFGSLFPLRRGTSRLAFYVVLAPDGLETALAGIQGSVDALRKGEISDEEIVRAKGSSLGSLSLDRETALDNAWNTGLFELMGLGTDYPEKLARQVEKLGRADLVKVAERYMDKYTLVVLRPKKGR